ncbi:hypothetical protein [Streptomyces lavendofoliae]|uniref:Uncharacterized protein n=1 Tax=Streptomyces lavendofoliae TaxID=67314 RepID=A0A918HWY3_9ACTN|nr:hypothetical protein [Streptomyces lavendofoliae]GGU32979.1 hypothetical protein GCM10010274_20140 [Streptomyces lavendofoliae]
MRTAPAPGPRAAKTASAPEDEKNNPQNPNNQKNTQGPDSEDADHNGPDSPRVPAGPRKRTPALIFDDPLDQPSADDTDRGWGERPPAGDSAADLARFLDEKPPHHL